MAPPQLIHMHIFTAAEVHDEWGMPLCLMDQPTGPCVSTLPGLESCGLAAAPCGTAALDPAADLFLACYGSGKTRCVCACAAAGVQYIRVVDFFKKT